MSLLFDAINLGGVHHRTLGAQVGTTMIVGIELRPIAPGVSGGIVMVLQGVLNQLFRQFPDDQYHLFTTLYSRGILDAESLPNVHCHTLPTRTFYRDMDHLIAQAGVTALFRSYPVSDDSTFPMDGQIVLIPDVQHEHRPEFFDPGVLRCRRAAFNRWLAHAGAIGTISAHARQQIQELPATACTDIFLMPPALGARHVPVTPSDLTEQERALIPDVPFFYYPANLWTHKNHARLLQAFKIVADRSTVPMKLVLSGHPDGFDKLIAPFDGLAVQHLGFVRPQLVRMLLQQALAMPFVSQYEGFGIPLLEAFSAGCPVVCSNTTSLPEVAADAAIQVDPTDIPALASAMTRIANEPSLRRELVQKGHARLRDWTWERSAQQLHAAFERITQRPIQHAAAPQALTVAPPRPGLIARIRTVFHVYWYEKGFTIPRAWREIVRRARAMVFKSPALNILAERSRVAARLLDRLNVVRGLRADNTLSRATRIVIDPHRVGQPLRLCGSSSGEGSLTVLCDRKILLQGPLRRGQRQCFEFALPPESSGAITIRLDAGARFQLDETNLFAENDTY